MPKQAPAFSSQCDGQIDANSGEGKVRSPEEGQDSGGWPFQKSILCYFSPKP